jgi:hypothetical protein
MDDAVCVRMYSVTDEAAVAAVMPELMQEAEALRARHVLPTTAARHAITDTVLAFVRARGLKVYGGYALNAAVSAVSPADAFYSCDPDASPPDIEFYSSDPIADVCELCRMLHAAGHRYVQGKEAMHHGTFTVSVEFVRMCDVTYVPPRAYDALPTITDAAEGIEVIAPSFAMIDLLRVVCDPFTSHWRLDRMFSRLALLQRTFPLSLAPAVAAAHNPPRTDGPRVARAFLAYRPTSCVAVGFAAFRAYFPERDTVPGNVVSAVTSRWAENTYDLEVALVSAFGRERVQVNNHAPFMDLFGRRRVFLVALCDEEPAEVAAVLYDAGHRAVPTCGLHAEDGLAIAAFPYVLAMALSCAFHARAEGSDPAVAQRFERLAAEMCAARAERLELSGMSVVDRRTPLRDFGGMQYVGNTLSPMRSHMLLIDERMATRRGHEQAWFTFDPAKEGGNPARSFSDVSGALVVAPEEPKPPPPPASKRGGARNNRNRGTTATKTPKTPAAPV